MIPLTYKINCTNANNVQEISTAKTMTNEKQVIHDPAIVRFMAWVDDHGGCARVANALGKRPQILYNIRDGKNRIGMETVQLIAAVYPDFDLNWIMIGESRMPGAEPIRYEQPPTSEVNGLSALVWEERYWALDRRHRKLYDAVLSEKLGRELDFLRVSSQASTCADRVEIEGFRPSLTRRSPVHLFYPARS